ncbi:hypothetical protein CTKA_00211 [Chthonomonas calidirosea]|uniref:Uncharacterized protein n=1 Tax=Chthonomonas calidirosea (strain DSM 23976 / ICMP 18418 / T49) TaxID=1303518 RepID=S0EY74_CHTCT|nr:hypothetical protein [Chthonomonas calidirosea]CCW34770.1 hypothetical protein CCALI_00948 [Chthonomonas calidirosea T49]CEK13841.1 hypothetical protein CTKA_00211 [Chthonomonas calidirosea]
MEERFSPLFEGTAQARVFCKLYAQANRLALLAERIAKKQGDNFSSYSSLAGGAVQRIPLLLPPEYEAGQFLSLMPSIGYVLGMSLELGRFCWKARACWQVLCQETSRERWARTLVYLQELIEEATYDFQPMLYESTESFEPIFFDCEWYRFLDPIVNSALKSRGEERQSSLLWTEAMGEEPEIEGLKEHLSGLGLTERAVWWWLHSHQALQRVGHRFLYVLESLWKARTLRGIWVHLADLVSELFALRGAVYEASCVPIIALERQVQAERKKRAEQFWQRVEALGLPVLPPPFGEAALEEEATHLTPRQHKPISLEPYQPERVFEDKSCVTSLKLDYKLVKRLYRRLHPLFSDQKLAREAEGQVRVKGLSYQEVDYSLCCMVRFYEHSSAILKLLEGLSATGSDEELESFKWSLSGHASEIGLEAKVLFTQDDWFTLGVHLYKTGRLCWKVGIEECGRVLQEAFGSPQEVLWDAPKRVRFTRWLADKKYLTVLYPRALEELELLCGQYRKIFEGLINREGGSVEGDTVLMCALYSLSGALGSIGKRFRLTH